MRLPYYIIPKLNNLTNCEMTLYLWLCERQNNLGVVKGVTVGELKPIMSKQSFYNAVKGLYNKELIYKNHHKDTHDYDIGLWQKRDVDEGEKGYINLHNQLFQSEDFKKLNSKEKYLLFCFYKQTSVTISSSGSKAVRKIDKKEFYDKYIEILQRTERRIREYLHSLKKFFNISWRKEENNKIYYIGRNRNTYRLDKKMPGTGVSIHRKYYIKSMIRRYQLKGIKDKFISDVVKLYRNYIKNFSEYEIDRCMEKAIAQHAKDNNQTASAARVHTFLREELGF